MNIYWNIAGGWHCGEEAMELHYVPNASQLSSVELDALGWEKRAIPDFWEPHCRYVNGQLIVRPDPPPYWDELGKGLITNSLFQRIRPLRYQAVYSIVNGAMSDIEAVVGISREQEPLGYILAVLRSILDSLNMPITPAEITETEALLEACGFYPNFFTYAENVFNPPPPPAI